ncbi:4-hydroxy-tetrahydrodipicolinate reductase [Desulfosoma caldarium]|uniref:4-hydroxy-tetrahydrodipicolinate reductase n=1 Tax=Desulfosoma caldarium TaxID=610254 RepID=A0A3N1UUN4_9BACT|nr:4-hydroxy-tetrahydrodipicolinate reductase [Desulfosoma caldarium]ROQ92257.1 dihydrodipicolinate reductase [Desulfosoma caldarium]
MVRAAVAGIGGRMGSRIAQILGQTEGITLVGGLERPGHAAVGCDVGALSGTRPSGVVVEDTVERVLERCDVLIDFTVPEASLNHMKAAAAAGRAMVIGTTGFSPDQQESIRTLAQKIACVLAPNMSVGVNVLFKVLRDIARLLGPDYDVEIVEAHHRFKKDAPSGTALKLADAVAQARGCTLEDVGVYARHGLIGERPREAIGIQTLRGGDVVGEHTVFFYGMGERIEVTHRAHSRDNFARGAITAAKWVVGKPAGLYSMLDVLGIAD